MKNTVYLILAGFIMSSSQAAWGGVNLRPNWSKSQSNVSSKPNGSFLMDLEEGAHAAQTFRDELFDPKLASRLKQEYLDMNRDYELKKNHDLIGIEEQRAYVQKNSEFTVHVLNEVKDVHLQKKKRELGRNIRKEINKDKTLRDSAAVAAMAAGIYYGQPVDIKVTEETKVRAKTQVPQSKGELGVESPIVNGSFEYTGRAPERTVLDAPLIDPTTTEERYKFKLSKAGLPWDLSTGVSYGSTTSTMTASVSKKLSDHLTCVVDSSHPADTKRADPKSTQESVKLLYGVSF